MMTKAESLLQEDPSKETVDKLMRLLGMTVAVGKEWARFLAHEKTTCSDKYTDLAAIYGECLDTIRQISWIYDAGEFIVCAYCGEEENHSQDCMINKLVGNIDRNEHDQRSL
jgi:hypothetical protein